MEENNHHVLIVINRLMRDNIYYYSQLTHLVGNKLALLGTELELIRKLILYVSVKQNNQHKKQNKQKQKTKVYPGRSFPFSNNFFLAYYYLAFQSLDSECT